MHGTRIGLPACCAIRMLYHCHTTPTITAQRIYVPWRPFVLALSCKVTARLPGRDHTPALLNPCLHSSGLNDLYIFFEFNVPTGASLCRTLSKLCKTASTVAVSSAGMGTTCAAGAAAVDNVGGASKGGNFLAFGAGARRCVLRRLDCPRAAARATPRCLLIPAAVFSLSRAPSDLRSLKNAERCGALCVRPRRGHPRQRSAGHAGSGDCGAAGRHLAQAQAGDAAWLDGASRPRPQPLFCAP